MSLALLLANATLLAGTVAQYRFEDGSAGGAVSRIVDSGPNHLDGVSGGSAPIKYTAATPGSASHLALDLSGDLNFGKIPHNPAMVLQGSWTVEMFVKANVPYARYGGSIGDPEHYSIITKQNNSGFGGYLAAWSMAFQPNNGHLLGYIGFGNNAGVIVESTNSIADGNWHHIALVLGRNFRGSLDRLLLYLDGNREGQVNQDMPDLFYGEEPLFLGAGNFGNDPNGTGDFRRNFDGLIDEVRISDQALDPSQFLSKDAVIVTPPQPFSLSISRVPPDKLQVGWTAEQGRTYQLQAAGAASSAAWQNLGNPIAGAGSKQTVDLQIDSSRRYYRVIIP